MEWSGEGEAVREDEVGGMLLSGDGDAVGSFRMAMASGGAAGLGPGEEVGGARRRRKGRLVFRPEDPRFETRGLKGLARSRTGLHPKAFNISMCEFRAVRTR